MLSIIKKMHRNQRASLYIEMALLIIGVGLAVASQMTTLGSTMGTKITDIKGQVELVGN
ncbi:MAG: hypothetical protein ACOY30_10995 [Bacillota bacterium]